MALAAGSCGRGADDDLDDTALTENEQYLVDAYVDVKRASSRYSDDPVVAESLFTVLDSTIDSVRIANTIRDVNRQPDRWLVIFEEIEKKLRAQGKRPGPASADPGPATSEQPGG